MNSVTVATAAGAPAATQDTGKLPAIKLATGPQAFGSEQQQPLDNSNSCSATESVVATASAGLAQAAAQVVIIKTESSEETVQNGGTSASAAAATSTTTNTSSSGEGATMSAEGASSVTVKVENGGGAMESLESGVAKVAINGTNQNRMIRTASAKGKHLTRSHAMRESASPPRTPTICNGGGGGQQSPDGQESTTADSVTGIAPSTTTPEVITPPKSHPTESGGKAPSQLDLDFPKLNAPKPKSPRNNMEKSQSSSDSSKSVNSLDPHSPTATLNRKGHGQGQESAGGLARNLSPSSQHSNKELSALDMHDNSPLLSPGSYDNRSGSGRDNSKSPSGENRNSGYHSGGGSGGNSGGKKHKGASAAKNAKTPRLKAQGSSSSVEGNNNNNNSTVFISKDNSFEQFTDQSGVDLIKFFRETLNKNTKDRSMLLKIEKELHDLATDRNRHQVKFPSMSSYNRMLIHRCAAYFGMDHNVDTSQTSVIVAVTKSTRIPEILFDTLIRETLLDEPRKSILKRDSHSFDECRQSLLPNPDRGLLDRKAKSFEEREEEYDKARRRIFKGRELVGFGRCMQDMQDENSWPWSSTESSDNSTKIKAQNNRLLKVHSLSVDTRHDRPSVSKSHSFGGYGGPSGGGGGGGGGGNHHNHHLNRGDSITSTKSAGPRFFTKQDSMGGTPWRLSPSSSGYKTQTQSLRSDSITPSPTGGGYEGSGGEHTPEPQSAQSPGASGAATGGGSGGGGNRSVVWAVTDMASVPRGSVLIDPQTLQPIVNQDGSIYYFDPSNVPPIAMKMTHHGPQMNRHYPPPFMTGGGGGGGGHPSNRRRPERSNNSSGSSNRGPCEENVLVGNNKSEKGGSSSNTGSIDVIPEDQFQGNCTPTDVDAVASANNSGSAAVPSEEGSHYTKGETPSPEEDLEDCSDKGGVGVGVEVEEREDHLLEQQEQQQQEQQLEEEAEVNNNVERIFVPEHKHQATSPSHPMATQQSEEYVVVAATASDTELASSSQCLTPQVLPPPPHDQQQQSSSQLVPDQAPPSTTTSLQSPSNNTTPPILTSSSSLVPGEANEVVVEQEAIEGGGEVAPEVVVAMVEGGAGGGVEDDCGVEDNVMPISCEIPQDAAEGRTEEDAPEKSEVVVTTNASSTDNSHSTMTISTTCTSSSSPPSTTISSNPLGGGGGGAASVSVESSNKSDDTSQNQNNHNNNNSSTAISHSSGSNYAHHNNHYSNNGGNRTTMVHKPFNRYSNHNHHNSQGDPRSHQSTTIASPSNTSSGGGGGGAVVAGGGYQMHAIHAAQPQFVTQAPLRHEDQMQGYQPAGIAYSTTAIDANGNTYATGATNMPYAATYQQMPESGGYMVYAAPYPMEAVGEMPGYYVPVYDQAGNATLVPATATTGGRGDHHQQTTTILQATAAPPHGTAVYQAAPNTTLIPALPAGSQLVYAPDGQFGAAAAMQPAQQFAASYPPGTTVTYAAAPYGTAYNAAPSTYHPNFWGQPMTTYYVSSPPAQALPQATAVPIQIPVPMPPQQVNTQHSQSVKSGQQHSSPPTPQATTFAGNPFNSSAGQMQMTNTGGQEGMQPPPVYAMQGGGGPHHGQNKYQNVYSYSTPVVPATPPTAIYSHHTPPYHQQAPVHAAGSVHKPATTHSPAQGASANNNDLQTNSSSSTPLQKSPPTQMPEQTGGGGGNVPNTQSYDKKPRRGPPTEMSGSNNNPQSQNTTGPPQQPPPQRTGYLGNNYNPTYARNPNQPYTPRGYAPKKHYSTEGGAPNVMGPNKPIVMNTPMNHQSSPSPGIYNHYHPSGGAGASGGGGAGQAPNHQPHPAGGHIRGPRPKPANLDLRRTGSHYQSQSAGQGVGVGGGVSAPVAGNGNSQRNTPSTNSTESNNSPNSVTGGGGGPGGAGGNGMGDHPNRGNSSNNGQMGYYPAPNSGGGVPQHHGGHPLVMHQPLMGPPANAVGPGGHPGMYVKLGQTYFPHPTIATPMGGNRRSPPNEIRPQFNHHPHSLTTGLYPMNMQISGPRHGASGPRHSHHTSYKGSR